MPRTKVLFVDTPISPSGGGQKSLLLLMRNLPGEDFDVSVAVPDGPATDFEADVRASGLEPHKVRRSFFAVRRLLRELAPDLVHCNSATTRLSFYAALAAKLRGVPFVWHVRVIEQAGWKDKAIALLSRKIIVISGAVGRRFSWTPEKVVKVYNAVDTRRFAPGPGPERLRKEFGVPAGAKVIGIFARLGEFKGHKVFLRMAKELLERSAGCFFLVVGAGEEAYARELKEYSSALKLGDSVVFTGHRNDIPELMALCDVVVAASNGLEAFGRTLIEAMACGKPVVAGAAGGMPEIIEDGKDGLLVAGGGSGDFAAAVSGLLSDPARAAELGRNGREKVERCFNVEQHVRNIKEIYSEILL